MLCNFRLLPDIVSLFFFLGSEAACVSLSDCLTISLIMSLPKKTTLAALKRVFSFFF